MSELFIPYLQAHEDVYVDQDLETDSSSISNTPAIVPSTSERFEWVAIIDQTDDSTSVWAGEFELMSMADIENEADDSTIDYTSIVTRPPTPPWSQNQPWATTLEDINIQCIGDLNTAFQSSSNRFDDLESNYKDEEDSEYVSDFIRILNQQDIDQPPLDLLEQTFEQIRQRANAIIDEAKAKAIAVIKDQIPTQAQKDAVGWYTKRLNIVMGFMGYIGKSMRKAIQLLMNGAKGAWMSILRTLRIGVARRAMVAAQGVRNLQSVAALAITAGNEGPPVRVWLR